MELGLLTIQAARGVRSHYNNFSTLDISIYATMGIFVFVNFFIVAHLARIWVKSKPNNLSHEYHLSVSWGFFIFLLTNILAFYMSAQPWSRVGSYNSQGLSYFTGWNQAGGDLRISHFIGLHAFQLLPLLGSRAADLKIRSGTIHSAGIILTLFLVGSFVLAALGIPLLR